MAKKFTPAQVVAALKETRGMQALAANKLGCTVRTINRYANTYPEVQTEIEQQREAMLDTAESKLYSAIDRGEAWAICFFLKTQGKKRHYSERMEVVGPDGQPVVQPQIVVVSQAAKDLTQKVITGERTMIPAGGQN
jgi:hypothetical protein